MSYSADSDPGSIGFNVHRGYEADLLTALEAMKGSNLTFDRCGIAEWGGIWLLPAGPQYDLVGGGITILESRSRDAAGRRAIVFTAGHIEFRQSLLVRATDAVRLGRHQDGAPARRCYRLGSPPSLTATRLRGPAKTPHSCACSPDRHRGRRPAW